MKPKNKMEKATSQENLEEHLCERKDDKEAQERIEQLDVDRIADDLSYPFLKSAYSIDKLRFIEPMARLSIEIEDDLLKYDTILSDDASGRLPSLFFRKLINKNREEAFKKAKEKGEDVDEAKKSSISTYCVASGRYGDEEKQARATEKIKEFLKEKKNELGKVLVVTEHIETGKSIMMLVNILEELGIDFDVAAISVKDLSNCENSLKKKLKYGEKDEEGGAAFKQTSSITGVAKNLSDEVSAHPQKTERRKITMARMKQAREDMAMLADRISKIVKVN